MIMNFLDICLRVEFLFRLLLGFDYLQGLTGEAQIQLKTAAEKHWSDGALDVINIT
jgi:hypothetical protein